VESLVQERETSNVVPRLNSRTADRHIFIISGSHSEDSALARILKKFGYVPSTINRDGLTLTLIADARSSIEAIILDQRGTKTFDRAIVDGLAGDPRVCDIPKILLVNSQTSEQISAALDAGVQHYLQTPFQAPLLQSMLHLVWCEREAKRQSRLQLSDLSVFLPMIETCKLRVRTPAEAARIVPMLAGFFPDSRRAEVGIKEILTNAIEHGNLEIGGELKSELSKSGALEQEVYVRLSRPEFASRSVEVVVSRTHEGVMLIVTDGGRGFAWRDRLDVDPAMANQVHGRGIAMARHIAFDRLTYNEAGNQAIALMKASPPLQW
jgi:two-component system, cell cycle response regulator